MNFVDTLPKFNIALSSLCGALAESPQALDQRDALELWKITSSEVYTETTQRLRNTL